MRTKIIFCIPEDVLKLFNLTVLQYNLPCRPRSSPEILSLKAARQLVGNRGPKLDIITTVLESMRSCHIWFQPLLTLLGTLPDNRK